MEAEQKVVEVVEDEQDGREGEREGGLVLPPGLSKPAGVVAAEYHVTPHHVVVMWELTPREERLALKRCKGSDLDVGYQLLRQSIRAVNGEFVDWKEGRGDAMLDRLFAEVGSKGRALLVEAYRRQCTPSEEESEAFFGSVRVGV